MTNPSSLSSLADDAQANPSLGRSERVAWPDVLRALPRSETRSYALNRFRESRFDADSFGHKTKARAALAEALTRTEDWLERQHPAWRDDRARLRDLRRRLERELWP